MRAGKFLEQIRHDDLVAAIGEAEKKTSGEIRVFISHKAVPDAVAVAQRHFVGLGMDKTRDHNAVLIFVVPRSRKFAVIGDTGVHARCGDRFWRELAAEISGHFAEHQFNRGLLHAIKKAGDLLAEHFPHRPDDQNELPDTVETD